MWWGRFSEFAGSLHLICGILALWVLDSVICLAIIFHDQNFLWICFSLTVSTDRSARRCQPLRSARRFPADDVYLWYWLMYSLIFNYHVAWLKEIKAQGNWVKGWRIFGQIIYCYIIYQDCSPYTTKESALIGVALKNDSLWILFRFEVVSTEYLEYQLNSHLSTLIIEQSYQYCMSYLNFNCSGSCFCMLRLAGVYFVKQEERYFFVWVSIICLL